MGNRAMHTVSANFIFSKSTKCANQVNYIF